MKAALSLGSWSLSVVAGFLLVSLANCSPSHKLHVHRREAIPEPEPESTSSSSPVSSSMSSTPSSSSVMMSHEGHNVTCEEKDTATLKTSCPGNGTCPSDNETLEKCCHCISACCEASGNGTGKDIGTKVKDAISSAEGWLKNQGQNIKNSWDKAKEGIKQTANDVKDKVKKGMDTVANKFRNATSSENSTESMENSSESNTPMPMTSTPGQKTKRDLYGLSSPTMVETYYSGGKKNSDSEDSDSDEYSWSRRTTSMTGNRDMNNRRYKREMSSNPNSMSSNNATTNNTTASNSTSTDKTSRTKRGSDKISTPVSSNTTTSTRTKRDNHHNESNSDPLPAVKTSSATTVTEGTVTESGRTSSSSSNSKSRYRRAGNKDGTTPSPPEATTGTPSNGTEGEETEEDKDSPQANNSDSSGKNEGKNNSRRRDSNVSISVHVLGPPKSPRSNRNSKGNKGTSGGDGNHHRTDSTQYPILFPGEGDDQSSTMESSEDADGMDVVVDHPPVVYPDRYRGGVISMSAYSSSGGPGSGNGNNPYPESPKMGQSVTAHGGREVLLQSSSGGDMAPYTMRIENGESSMLSSPSAMWRQERDDGYDNHGHEYDTQKGTGFADDFSSQPHYRPVKSSYPSVITDGETSRTNGTFSEIGMAMNSTSNSNSGTGNPVMFGKQENCRPLTEGFNCITFQPYAAHCSYDSDCTGSMKCCFNTCEPYKQVGICEDSSSS